MRVLHVIPSVSPLRGGPSLAVVEMVKALRAGGVDAEIVTTNDHGDSLLNVPLNRSTEWQGVPVRFFRRWSPGFRPFREFLFSHGLSGWVRAHASDYDVVHVHALFSHASTSTMSHCRRVGVPYLSRPLGQLCRWALQRRSLKKRVFLAAVERANLVGAAALHFTTEQERLEASVLALKSHAFVAPHGLQMPPIISGARERLRAELQLPQDEPLILFLSRIHAKKGLELLVPALAQLKKKERFTFLLAGHAEPASYDQHVEKLLHESGIAPCTRRLGFISGERKQLVLQGADLFTLTSHSENFGLVVLEALASRIPVVVTHGVALSQWVSENDLGHSCASNSDAIEAALHGELRALRAGTDFGERARSLVQSTFSWESVTRILEAEYQRCLRI